MFEAFELGRTLSKEDFDAQEGPLREALLEAQMDLKTSKKFGVVVIIGGVKGAGKRETVGVLNSWMDPRFIDTLGLREPSDEERERPPMWRFWRMLPPKGRIALFHGSWHTMPIVNRAFGRISGSSMEREMERVRGFETMLAHEGVLVLKFWMHLAKKLQKKRMRAIEDDPLTSWRITKQDWENFERYDTFRKVSARAIQLTSTAEAPWILVEATDPRHQIITVGRHILENLRARLGGREVARPLGHVPPAAQRRRAGGEPLRSWTSPRPEKRTTGRAGARWRGRRRG